MAPGLFSCLAPPGRPSTPGLFLPPGRPREPHLLAPSLVDRPVRRRGCPPVLKSRGNRRRPAQHLRHRRSLTQCRPKGRGSPGGGQRHHRGNAPAPARRPTQGRGGRRAERGLAGPALPGGKPRGRNPTAPSPKGDPLRTEEEGQEPHVAFQGPPTNCPVICEAGALARANAPTRPAKGRAATKKIAPSRRAPRRPRAACPR